MYDCHRKGRQAGRAGCLKAPQSAMPFLRLFHVTVPGTLLTSKICNYYNDLDFRGYCTRVVGHISVLSVNLKLANYETGELYLW